MADEAGFSVIVVDDNADLRRLYRFILEEEPFRFLGDAEDGARGVALARETRPDLVILDLSMPGMDGLEALLAIRRVTPASRVVVLSGFTRSALGPLVLELGATDYVEKGVRPMELRERLLRAAEEPPRPVPPNALDVAERARMLI